MQLLQPADNTGILPIAYFHALAHLGEEGLILIEPAHTFVSLGFFDDAATTVNRDYCHKQDIPIMRRETGGGMVLLGPGQVFYTLVLKRPHASVPSRVDEAYQHLSKAPISVYQDLGITATLRPVNDIVTKGGRKIAGQGAGDINGHFCFVGSILLDFDIELMHRVVQLPNEDLRMPLKAALKDHLTSVTQETGARPTVEAVKRHLVQAFAPLVGGLSETDTPQRLLAKAREVAAELSAPETVFSDETEPAALFKVREGLYLCQRALKGAKGAILVSVTICEGHISAISVSGPGIPEGAPYLDRLIGLAFQAHTLSAHLPDIATLGLTKDQFVAALFARRS